MRRAGQLLRPKRVTIIAAGGCFVRSSGRNGAIKTEIPDKAAACALFSGHLRDCGRTGPRPESRLCSPTAGAYPTGFRLPSAGFPWLEICSPAAGLVHTGAAADPTQSVNRQAAHRRFRASSTLVRHGCTWWRWSQLRFRLERRLSSVEANHGPGRLSECPPGPRGELR